MSTQTAQVELSRTTAISERKLSANRRNAQNSTGPTSERGKKISSRNAIKHGILSKQLVAYGRQADREEWQHFFEQVWREWRPEGMLESMLLEEIACTWYRISLVIRAENSAIASQNEGVGPIPGQDFRLPDPSDAAIILRYDSQLTKKYYRALAELERVQKNRRNKD